MVEAYLVHDIFERVGAVDGKANENKICFRIRERSETVVLLLTGGVPEGELNCLAGRLVRCMGNIVLEDGGNVFLFNG